MQGIRSVGIPLEAHPPIGTSGGHRHGTRKPAEGWHGCTDHPFSVRDARQLGIALAILVTEDYVVNQRLVARMLEKRGHKVFVVANGQEALDALAKDEYDLVFMDVQMPRDGWTDGNYDSQREGGWLAKTPSGHCLNCARLER